MTCEGMGGGMGVYLGRGLEAVIRAGWRIVRGGRVVERGREGGGRRKEGKRMVPFCSKGRRAGAVGGMRQGREVGLFAAT